MRVIEEGNCGISRLHTVALLTLLFDTVGDINRPPGSAGDYNSNSSAIRENILENREVSHSQNPVTKTTE